MKPAEYTFTIETQRGLANDWQPLREDMIEFAKAYRFEVRETDHGWEFRMPE